MDHVDGGRGDIRRFGPGRRSLRPLVERAVSGESMLPEVSERLLPEADAVRQPVQVLRAERLLPEADAVCLAVPLLRLRRLLSQAREDSHCAM
jgi:hypothetical protein